MVIILYTHTNTQRERERTKFFVPEISHMICKMYRHLFQIPWLKISLAKIIVSIYPSIQPALRERICLEQYTKVETKEDEMLGIWIKTSQSTNIHQRRTHENLNDKQMMGRGGGVEKNHEANSDVQDMR